MIFYASPAAEEKALRRSAARGGCTVERVRVAGVAGAPHAMGHVECPDGWAAARMLVALAEEDAATPAAQALAGALRRKAPSDAAFAREVHAYVKRRVRFEREPGEIFQNSGVTLALGVGDCDDHARLTYALARAGGLPVQMAFLHHDRAGDDGPTHVVAQLCPEGDACGWTETTLDAAYGEHPLEAARRLGLIDAREDLATEVTVMTDRDLPPIPARYLAVNPDVSEDVRSLKRLGYLCESASVGDAADPVFREALLSFQIARSITPDGLIGPESRAEIGEALAPTEDAMGAIGAGIGEGAMVPVVTSKHISDAFLRGVVDMARAFNAKGSPVKAESFLAVWLGESGIKAQSGNAKFKGLNAMGPSELKSVGWVRTPEEYQALTLEQQLPYVRRFYETRMQGRDYALLDNAAAIYLLNFVPAYFGHADEPSWVIASPTKDPEIYKWNKVLDIGNKGYIEVADMSRWVAQNQVQAGKYWIEVRKRSYAIAGEPDGGGVPPLGGIVAIAAVLGVGALASWIVATS